MNKTLLLFLLIAYFIISYLIWGNLFGSFILLIVIAILILFLKAASTPVVVKNEK